MTSTINPNIPVNNTFIDAPPIQANFLAAYNDINGLQANITTLSGDISTINGEITTLQTEIGNLASNGNYANVLTYFTGSTNIRVACQNAVNAVSALGGGSVFLPAGTYSGWDCSVPLILPSNIFFYGVRSQTRIIPNMATVAPNLTPPLATGAMIMTGNPTTGDYAGINTSAQTINPATIVTNVHVYGITIDNSSYGGAGLPDGTTLKGINLRFAQRCSIIACEGYNVPNSACYFFGCRDADMFDNHVESGGFLVSSGDRNGISCVGWIDTAQSSSSSNYKIIGNTSNYNSEEGIEYDTCQGVICTKNTLIGNHQYGIEGQAVTPASTDTSATYGYAVPADAIIEGNYIDGFDALSPNAPWYGSGGIIHSTGNQGKTAVKGNIIKNLLNSNGDASGSGIFVSQLNNGVAHISDNTFDNITPGSTGSLIEAGAQSIFINGNMANGCSSGSTMVSIGVSNGFTDLTVTNNHSTNGAIHRFSFATLDAGAGTTAMATQIIYANNSTEGTLFDAIRFNFPHNVTIAKMDVSNNTFHQVNGTGQSANGFIRFSGAGGFTSPITEFDCTGNKVDFAATTVAPIIFDATMTNGSITTANISENKFGNTTQNSTVNTPGVITNLYAWNNGCPGQRITTGTVTPGSGTWAVGDMVFNSVPVSGSPAFWGCSVAGTGTGATWVHVLYA